MNQATISRASRRLAMLRWLATALVAGVLAWLSGPVAAAPVPPGSGAEADPPGRVGRIADLQGQIWVYSPDSGEWIGAGLNRVLTTADRVATDADARAELRVGSTTVRMDGGTEIEFVRLDDQRIDLRVHDGSIALRVRNPEKLGEIAVLTGEGRFVFHRTGRYRIDRADEASHLTVFHGEGLYEGPRSALTVYSGQRAQFWIDAAGVAQYTLTDPQHDAFSAWNSDRDRAEDRALASSQYVSPEMTGAEDLDRYGRWERSDEYGALWIPHTVAAGWAPYSTGHWAWVRPWGWTWVDDAPWGFAPFHYGRWVWFRGTWCWAPGQRVLRPVFAPALVAWVGGSNFSFSINVGGGPAVGWFPLAPHEVYVPAYRASPIYVRKVNITNVTNVTVINNAIVQPPRTADLRNRKFPHAVTVVPANVVSTRQPVAPVASRLRDNAVVRQVVQSTIGSGAPLNAFAPPVAAPAHPTRPVDAAPPVPPSRVRVPARPIQRDERRDARDERADRRDDALEQRRDERRDPRLDRRELRDDRRDLRDDRADEAAQRLGDAIQRRDDRRTEPVRSARPEAPQPGADGREPRADRGTPSRPVPPPGAERRRPGRPTEPDGAAARPQPPARPRQPASPSAPQRPPSPDGAQAPGAPRPVSSRERPPSAVERGAPAARATPTPAPAPRAEAPRRPSQRPDADEPAQQGRGRRSNPRDERR